MTNRDLLTLCEFINHVIAKSAVVTNDNFSVAKKIFASWLCTNDGEVRVAKTIFACLLRMATDTGHIMQTAKEFAKDVVSIADTADVTGQTHNRSVNARSLDSLLHTFLRFLDEELSKAGEIIRLAGKCIQWSTRDAGQLLVHAIVRISWQAESLTVLCEGAAIKGPNQNSLLQAALTLFRSVTLICKTVPDFLDPTCANIHFR